MNWALNAAAADCLLRDAPTIPFNRFQASLLCRAPGVRDLPDLSAGCRVAPPATADDRARCCGPGGRPASP